MTPFAIGAKVRVTDPTSTLYGFAGEIVETTRWPHQWRIKFPHYPEPLLMIESALEVLPE